MSGLLNLDWLSEKDVTNHRRKWRTEYVFNVLCICLPGYKRLSKGCDCKQEGILERSSVGLWARSKARTMSEEGEENAPIFLSFNDLGVKINDRQILQNVSGKVHPGEMLAVMGPSGKLRTFKNTFLPFNRIKWPVNWKVIISRCSNLCTSFSIVHSLQTFEVILWIYDKAWRNRYVLLDYGILLAPFYAVSGLFVPPDKRRGAV